MLGGASGRRGPLDRTTSIVASGSMTPGGVNEREHVEGTVKNACVLVLAAGALLAGSPGARADEPVKMNRRIVVHYHQCWNVMAGYGRMSPEDRVGKFWERLIKLAATTNLKADCISLAPRGRFTDIYVGSAALFTVTPADARAAGYGENTNAVAGKWARELRIALPDFI